mgnify:CR=1 FL=1
MEEQKHTFTTELIYHFTCVNCLNWWSWADSNFNNIPHKYKMNCPHCGIERHIRKKDRYNLKTGELI